MSLLQQFPHFATRVNVMAHSQYHALNHEASQKLRKHYKVNIFSDENDQYYIISFMHTYTHAHTHNIYIYIYEETDNVVCYLGTDIFMCVCMYVFLIITILSRINVCWEISPII